MEVCEQDIIPDNTLILTDDWTAKEEKAPRRRHFLQT